MATSPIARKLQVKPNHQVAVVNAPEGYAALLEPLPEGARLLAAPAGGADVVQVFVRDQAELERVGRPVLGSVRPGGLLWVCYPKGGRKAGSDLSRDVLWELMSRGGLAGVTLVAIDDTWSCMRFRPAAEVGT
jgi:hypothetical protein